MKSDFWLLNPSRGTNMAITLGKYERVECSADPSHIFSEQKIGELWVELPSRTLSDFEWTWNSDIFVTPHAVDVLQKNNVTGFETRPLGKAVYKKRSRGEPPPLFELAVTGWGGMAARTAGVELVEFCPACRHRDYTIAEPSQLIDPSAWDGSDLFMVWPLPRYRFASNRLAEIIRSHPISGVRLIPANEIPMKRGTNLGPGSLKTWMPEERALEIGKRFDVL
jgi:hypothetical protein